MSILFDDTDTNYNEAQHPRDIKYIIRINKLFLHEIIKIIKIDIFLIHDMSLFKHQMMIRRK